MLDFIAFDGYFFANMFAVLVLTFLLLNKKTLSRVVALATKHCVSFFGIAALVFTAWTTYSIASSVEGTYTALAASFMLGWILRGKFNKMADRAARIGSRLMSTMVLA